MPSKRHKPEEIVTKLRQVDVLFSQDQNVVDAIRQIGVTEVTYYRWRQEFGGLKSDQVKRLKELGTENVRPISLVAPTVSLILLHSFMNKAEFFSRRLTTIFLHA
jgi:putative transposase